MADMEEAREIAQNRLESMVAMNIVAEIRKVSAEIFRNHHVSQDELVMNGDLVYRNDLGSAHEWFLRGYLPCFTVCYADTGRPALSVKVMRSGEMRYFFATRDMEITKEKQEKITPKQAEMLYLALNRCLDMHCRYKVRYHDCIRYLEQAE